MRNVVLSVFLFILFSSLNVHVHARRKYRSYETQLIVGVIAADGSARGYPLVVLAWHTLVQDIIGRQSIAVTFNPLTGTVAVFDVTALENRTLEVVFSAARCVPCGLVIRDSFSGTEWCQQTGQLLTSHPSVSERAEAPVQIAAVPFVVAPWRLWRMLHPLSRTVSLVPSVASTNASYFDDVLPEFPLDNGEWLLGARSPQHPLVGLYPGRTPTLIIGNSRNSTPLVMPLGVDRDALNSLDGAFLRRVPPTGYVLRTEPPRVVLASAADPDDDRGLPLFRIFLAGGLAAHTTPLRKLPAAHPEVAALMLGAAETLELPLHRSEDGTMWNLQGRAIAGLDEGAALHADPDVRLTAWHAAVGSLPHACLLSHFNASVDCAVWQQQQQQQQQDDRGESLPSSHSTTTPDDSCDARVRAFKTHVLPPLESPVLVPVALFEQQCLRLTADRVPSGLPQFLALLGLVCAIAVAVYFWVFEEAKPRPFPFPLSDATDDDTTATHSPTPPSELLAPSLAAASTGSSTSTTTAPTATAASSGVDYAEVARVLRELDELPVSVDSPYIESDPPYPADVQWPVPQTTPTVRARRQHKKKVNE